jgi:hypothetical protein
MRRRCFALAAALCGCGATPATGLRPAAVPPGHGAVIGRIQVFKGDSDVTGSCYVAVEDARNETAARLSLDESGWVFTTLPAGREMSLTPVSCTVWNGLNYFTRQLRFVVRGRGETTYFGHVRVRTEDRDGEILAAGILGGLASASVPVSYQAVSEGSAAAISAVQNAPRDDALTVDEMPRVAEKEYVTRYRSYPKLVTALAGGGRVRSEQPVAKAVTHKGVVSAQARLEGLLLTWLGMVRADKRGLALRVVRTSYGGGAAPCGDVVLAIDGKLVRLSAPVRAASSTGNPGHVVVVSLEIETLKALLRARDVNLQACGLDRLFSDSVFHAAREAATAYEKLLAEAGAAPPPEAVPSESAP